MPTLNGFNVVLADRVRETTQTTGTGTYSLDGAPTGFRTFVSGVGNGNLTIYTAALGSSWEVGIGTVTSGAPATLSRDAILASSNSNNAVNWPAGVKDIFVDLPASLASQIQEAPVVETKVTVFTASGTFNKDGDCLWAVVEVVGGGGGGGGTQSTTSSENADAGGGGGGGYARRLLLDADMASSVSVTVGAAGAGGVFGSSNPGTGGTSSFGAHVSATGGSGPAANSSATTGSTFDAGGAGGTGSSGYINVAGQGGGGGRVIGGVRVITGNGGSSHLGGGAIASGTSGAAGGAYGGGGGGASAGISASGRTGGAGAAGVVIVTEFLHP